MEYCVYILYSESKNAIYIGFTSDLISRFRSHNVIGMKGWTRRFRPWKVIFCEFYHDKSLAAIREAALKGGKGREWIRRKISDEYLSVGFISA
jgi:putative endonuclease